MSNQDFDDVNGYRQAFQKGDEKAFDFFFRKYYAPLCFFANTYLNSEDDAEDMVQECFAKLWNRHAVMTNPQAIKSFLYTIVRNGCIDALRKKKTVGTAMHGFKYFGNALLNEELDEITHAEMIRKIYAVIHELPPRVQQVFRMYYIEGKNHDEIASELYTSPKTVSNQRLKALLLIREKLPFLLAAVLFFS
jgi:RNA polymerase sigma-70 factor (family 1)